MIGLVLNYPIIQWSKIITSLSCNQGRPSSKSTVWVVCFTRYKHIWTSIVKSRQAYAWRDLFAMEEALPRHGGVLASFSAKFHH